MKSISLLTVAILAIGVALPASAESTPEAEEPVCTDWVHVAWSDLFAEQRVHHASQSMDIVQPQPAKLVGKPKFKVEKFWIIGVN